MRQVEDHAAHCSNAHLNTAALATRWLFRVETATARAGICRHDTQTIALAVGYALRAPWDDI